MTAVARVSRGRVIALSVGAPTLLMAEAGTLVLSWSARLLEDRGAAG